MMGCDLRSVRLRKRLGKQRNADHQLGAGAEPGNKAIDGEIEDALVNTA
jgi:hypothetical protein